MRLRRLTRRKRRHRGKEYEVVISAGPEPRNSASEKRRLLGRERLEAVIGIDFEELRAAACAGPPKLKPTSVRLGRAP